MADELCELCSTAERLQKERVVIALLQYIGAALQLLSRLLCACALCSPAAFKRRLAEELHDVV